MNQLTLQLGYQYNLHHNIPSFVKIEGLNCEFQTTVVTNGQYNSIMKIKSEVNSLLPKVDISWDECQKFINKLNEQSKDYIYSLPDEKDWEIACTDELDNLTEGQLKEYAWFNENTNKLQEVGLKLPNKYNLYDILGNVWEWCQNLYDPSGSDRVIRGGSWKLDAQRLRSAQRYGVHPGDSGGGVGFRLVRTLKR